MISKSFQILSNSLMDLSCPLVLRAVHAGNLCSVALKKKKNLTAKQLSSQNYINAPSFSFFSSSDYLHLKRSMLMGISLFLNVKHCNCFLWNNMYPYILYNNTSSAKLTHSRDTTNPYARNLGERKFREIFPFQAFVDHNKLQSFESVQKLQLFLGLLEQIPKQWYVFLAHEPVITSAENLMTQNTVNFVCRHC